MPELVAEPFNNEFGQVINPGDPVLFVGYNGYMGARVNHGVFRGSTIR